ncbi:MAG: type II secretion system GspH family protein [Puniceicoccales bacterium]|jgi:hypothetical protein|nr:type II secretion system GspH family protein [Puniceicoccales bacterium]
MQRHKRIGFSLLEVLLAIGVIGVALPAILTIWVSQIAALDASRNMVKLINAKKNFLAIISDDAFSSYEPKTMFLMRRLETIAGKSICKTSVTADASSLALHWDDEVFVISFTKDATNSLAGVFGLYDLTIRLSACSPTNPAKSKPNSPKHIFQNFYYSRTKM